ncbi:MAG TPA: DUF1549 and DUF1553 domain-containing protein [Gemmata sp.]|nr:DUF1549 and DUF1553 domain-containing protein [Gemmata sp.]
MRRLVVPPVLLVAMLCLTSGVVGQPKYVEREIKPGDREHWAFKSPTRPLPPAGGNPIDAFVRSELTKVGLKPSPEADRLTLIRRVTLDLTGLPPTPAEVEEFRNDSSSRAYEKVVDRLLASPHYGERWAQHWLDVVRFSETNGFELDAERPQAWRYRDFVIKSFNDDKPYDQFLTEQIAGDELAAGKDPKAAAELWIATGMHRCGQVHMVSGNLDPVELRQEQLLEMVNGVGSTFMGMTVGCARCHDHKFDPFSAGDYYRLQAFFASATYVDVEFATEADRGKRKKGAAALSDKMAPLKARIEAIDAPYREKITRAKRAKLEQKYRDALTVPAAKRTAEQKKLAADAGTLIKVTWDEIVAALSLADRERRAVLREELHHLEAQMPPPTPAAWAIKSTDPKAETFVLKRGNPHSKTIAVEAGFPRVLVNSAVEPKSRLDLTRWLARAEHPLTARVIVNRLWQHHFGRGIVATPNDFGIRGEKPTHPQLLDWLACELVDPDPKSGAAAWSLKHIHRLIVTSETYKQAANTAQGLKLDPENKLLWRMNRQRLDAEAVRDSIVTAAGTLNRQVGGVSVRVPLEQEVYDLIFTEGERDGLWPVTPDVSQHTRRSIYLFNKRNVRLPMLEALDQPDTLNSCPIRPVSTFAPQALIMMNGPFVQEQGKALAITLAKESPDGTKQIESLYRRALGRAPRTEEINLATKFLEEQTATIRDRLRARLPVGIDPSALPTGANLSRVRALADLCVVVFNLHEFVYRP